MSELIPGTTQPITQRSNARAGKPNPNQYEQNAYAMSEGQRLYNYFNCVGCHARGGGDIGPPLMDAKWIYGHEPENVYASIVQGRPNGMPAFGTRIPDYQIWQLVAYVRSLSGLVRADAAPAREDHMSGPPPPNSKDPETPTNSQPPKSVEMPQ